MAREFAPAGRRPQPDSHGQLTVEQECGFRLELFGRVFVDRRPYGTSGGDDVSVVDLPFTTGKGAVEGELGAALAIRAKSAGVNPAVRAATTA